MSLTNTPPQAVSRLLQSGRLLQEATDVSPYQVDGQWCLAEVFHGLRRHYYWTSNFDALGNPTVNPVLMGQDSIFRFSDTFRTPPSEAPAP